LRQHQIGLTEVISFEEQGPTRELCCCIGEAVTEVECCFVATFAKSKPRIAGDLPVAGVERYDDEACLFDDLRELVLTSLTETCADDDRGFRKSGCADSDDLGGADFPRRSTRAPREFAARQSLIGPVDRCAR
jgi:hypothetical protein